MSYATVSQARAEQTSDSSTFTKTALDIQMRLHLNQMTKRVDLNLPGEWGFEPVLDTRYYTPNGGAIKSGTGKLYLDAPLLEATAVVDSDGTTLTEWDGSTGNLSAATYKVDNHINTPYSALYRLDAGNNAYWSTPSLGASQITVTGYFGYRLDYSRDGFVDSTDALAAAITSTTATTFTVSDADGADGFGFSPRFSPGQLFRIGTEFFRCQAVNDTTNTITSERGVNGTTAATHLINAQIDTWYPDENIVRIVARGAAYMQHRAGKYENATFSIDGAGVIVSPADLLKEVAAVMDKYPDYTVYGEY